MRVRMTFDFDDDFRRALAAWYGKPGLATRKDFRAWINGMVDATADDVAVEYTQKAEEREERRMLREVER